MGARITINLNAGGEFEIWMNEEGRDLLVRELQGLSETSDHLHLMPRITPKPMGDIEVSSRAYRPDDKLLEWGKVLFRTDAGGRTHFPHVMVDSTED
jgi:hypothetical protein